MKKRKEKQDLFGEFFPALGAVLKPVKKILGSPKKNKMKKSKNSHAPGGIKVSYKFRYR